MAYLSEQWADLIKAENSVLVNIFHCPEALFSPNTVAYRDVQEKFVRRYVIAYSFV